MEVYAGLGIAQAVGTFMLGAILSYTTFFASKALHKVRSTLIKFFSTHIQIGCFKTHHVFSDELL